MKNRAFPRLRNRLYKAPSDGSRLRQNPERALEAYLYLLRWFGWYSAN